jgi:Gpi18-like mannosyltransferase
MKHTKKGNSSNTNTNFWVRYGWLLMVIATLVGLVLRNTQRGFETYDMLYDFVPWSEYLRTHGGFGGIATIHADYSVMYLYILAFFTYLPGSTMAKIKLVTVLVEIVAGFFIYLYVKRLYPNTEKRYISVIAYLCFIFLPSVILNGAVWGQVDIIYTCFLLICLYFLTSQKYNLAFLAYGLAFAFKLQAIFFLPFLGMHFLKTRKYSFAHFLWIPLVLFITSIPAIFLGRPAKEVFLVYFGQIGEYSHTVFNFGNIYTFLTDDYARFALPGIGLTLLLLFIGLFLILRDRKLTLTPFNLPDFALLSILICASFLPGMHERYMFAAGVIAVLYLFAHPLQFYIPLMLWVIEPNAYLIILWGMRPPIDYRLSALLLILVIILIIINVIKSRQTGMAEIQPV